MKDSSVGMVRLAVQTRPGEVNKAVRDGAWRGVERCLHALMAVAMLLGCLAVGARAQDVASITGTVVDKTDSPIAGANVKLTDTRTGAVYESQTGSFGAYLFAKVPPGPGYTLTISKDSFKTVTISGVYLAVAATRTQDVTMEIGTMTQTVEVQSEGSVSLDIRDNTIGNNFDMRAVESLPSEFRDSPAQLLRLEPGVVSAQSPDGSADPSGSRDGSVAGARADQNNITVDGIDAQEFVTGAAFSQIASVPIDAIQEFNTLVADPTPQNGRASGAQTIITTRSGTNDWHGTAQGYNRTAATEANTFFNNKDGVARPGLIRNQFGGNLGGPVRKDKLFFFFNYEGRRDVSQTSVEQIVPLDFVRNGGLGYINSNPGCGATSRIQSSPQCITVLPSAQVAAFDPCSQPNPPGPCTVTGQPGGAPVTPGFDQSLLTFIDSRYPRANDPSAGDGINTGGFRFNAPVPLKENIYLARVDYNLGSKQKLFTRFNFNNIDQISTAIQFSGDPQTAPQITRDIAWVIGHTWTFSANMVNQFVYGETRENVDFPVNFNPAGTVYPLSWFPGTPFSNPFVRQSSQSAIDPVPTFRDDFTLLRGKHDFQFGGVWKPIRTRSHLVNDFDFINVGVGGAIQSLSPNQRPADILQDPNGVANSNWDGYFLGFLGLINGDQSVFNYGKTGSVFAHGTGERRDYRYYNYEAYAQDSWKIRSDLTITYGVRYQYDSVPYETNGLEATAANTDLSQQLATRVANGLAGVATPASTPLLTYTLSGKANGGSAPSLYGGDKLNFSPRLAIAWNPSFRGGLLGDVFGERKTVIRVGGGMIYDQTAVSAINFLQDQGSYLFGNVNAVTFGTGAGTAGAIASDPRFTAINSLPFTLSAPPFQNPLTPFTSGSGSSLQVFGGPSGTFNYTIDPHFHTPYSNTVSVGLQRELPGGFQLELDYYGRFGRRLFSLADGGQVVNFIDPQSKQGLVGAIAALELAQRQGVNPAAVPTQAFFENQIAGNTGLSCSQLNGLFGLPYSSCTALVYAQNGVSLQQGNLAGVAFFLANQGLVAPNVGFPAQFTINTYVSNKAWSSYNGMLVSLRKRLSHNLQWDFNYTFSHSIDNGSLIANNNGNGFNAASIVTCDATDLSACRGNSEFDATHQISSNFVYDLPIGRGQFVGRNASRWLDEAIGGWQVSGIVTWRTGLAFPVQSGVGTTSFAAGADALAIFNGDQRAIAPGIHTDAANNNVIQFFANPTAALAAFSPVTGQQIGNRDILRGPRFSDTDLGVAKNFPLYREKYRLVFRADAFNVFNHPNFALPNSNINSPSFGQITALAGQEVSRVMQFSLRFQF
jgi:hypothetical protein